MLPDMQYPELHRRLHTEAVAACVPTPLCDRARPWAPLLVRQDDFLFPKLVPRNLPVVWHCRHFGLHPSLARRLRRASTCSVGFTPSLGPVRGRRLPVCCVRCARAQACHADAKQACPGPSASRAAHTRKVAETRTQELPAKNADTPTDPPVCSSSCCGSGYCNRNSANIRTATFFRVLCSEPLCAFVYFLLLCRAAPVPWPSGL